MNVRSHMLQSRLHKPMFCDKLTNGFAHQFRAKFPVVSGAVQGNRSEQGRPKVDREKSGTRQRCQASERMEIPPVREIAVIRSASAGIGRAGLEAASREVEELGGGALVIPTDVADSEAVEKAADRVAQKFGREDQGAHRRFDNQSRVSWPLPWASGNRGWIAAGAALAVGAGLVAARLRGGERNGHPTHQ